MRISTLIEEINNEQMISAGFIQARGKGRSRFYEIGRILFFLFFNVKNLGKKRNNV
ncbi:hypothetical protein [Marinisporobacter balticus]|uniref:Uncharacterized protein n=1 Tax=Marinisporobacter balticus TaxID=2018667 RepID=A0A4R2KR30_9FIRM|nr:hypothetical protein [Marinisporobacter balticus]TCO69065.1 hypothetical protein EV214_13517 [Marinisporobacter balticus]